MSSRAAYIERLLRESVEKDHNKPSRCTNNGDGTITVQISGVTAGLVYALSEETGEDSDDILRRL